jgi:hypothetical protein
MACLMGIDLALRFSVDERSTVHKPAPDHNAIGFGVFKPIALFQRNDITARNNRDGLPL